MKVNKEPEIKKQINVQQFDPHIKLLDELKERIKSMEEKLNSLSAERQRPPMVAETGNRCYNRGQSYRGFRNNSTFRGRGGYRPRNNRFFRVNQIYEQRSSNPEIGCQNNDKDEALIARLDESGNEKRTINPETWTNKEILQRMIGDANFKLN
ncbi:hypothetical protein DPMN_064937 [Dreissena polymorpha]|uniref:Uncharacterized protein n=1 Tax=Dreissena polymorpha TaxID=45954 RepID=A0A9D4CD58_DREPO|nr:hypothetical protein DPMN_064937 [Dreissena polymorpha]